MYNFEDLKQIKKKTEDRSEKKSVIYSDLFDEAMSYLEKFNKNGAYNKDYLIKASEKFMECINIKSNDERPYVFLAYISFVLDEPSLTHKYLSIASYMNEDSELVKVFRAKIGTVSVN